MDFKINNKLNKKKIQNIFIYKQIKCYFYIKWMTN